MEFTPHGVCSKNIHLEVDEAGRIHNVEFTGGCNGNLQGIGRLVEGITSNQIIFSQFCVKTSRSGIIPTCLFWSNSV